MPAHTAMPFPQPPLTDEAPCTEGGRQGAQRLFAQSSEVAGALLCARDANRRTREGRHALIRNGALPTRTELTGLGAVRVPVPRGRERRGAG